jgi:L-histidine Nalpha-methyltransferase
LQATGQLRTFVPLDVDEVTLRSAASAVEPEYPGLTVHAVVGDFHTNLADLPADGRRMIAFLGSTIGNLDPSARRRFLFDLDAVVRFDEWVLLGFDLVKAEDRLVAAYNDSAGVTAAFNLNLLTVLNRALDADFDVGAFEHVAVWNARDRWIEMRLRSCREQTVCLRGLGLEVQFAAGEELLTEISAKFEADAVEKELWEAGLVVEHRWTDEAGDFLLALARPYC